MRFFFYLELPMLRDLTIKNYRAFKDFSIDGLARVNLIVGDNNAGKTSFLEAVYLLKAQNDSTALLALLNTRGEYSEHTGSNGLSEYDFPIAHIFYGHEPRFSDAISDSGSIKVSSTSDKQSSLQISLKHLDLKKDGLAAYLRLRMASIRESLWGEYELQFDYTNEDPKLEPILYFVAEDFSIKPGFVRPDSVLGPSNFVTSKETDFTQLAQLWDQIALTTQEANIISALQILEPDVEGIRFTSRLTANSGALVKLRSQPGPIPLGSMGTGMRRILTLAISAVTAKDGVLLADEIDAGLYYRAQADMWRLLFKVAKERDIQIFATTHSWDCVAAFQEALAEDGNADQGYLFRLQRRGDRIYPVGYTSDDLDIAVRQAIEVR